MDSHVIISVVSIFAIGIILSRIMSEKAFRKLDDRMKLAIMNEFSGMRMWSIIPVFICVVLMVVSSSYYRGHQQAIFEGFIAALCCYLVIAHRIIRAKMVKIPVPEDYLYAFMRARWIAYLTITLMLVILFKPGIVHTVFHHIGL